MYLDYKNITFDRDGRPDTPELLLQTMTGEPIGTLSNVSDLRFNIKFSEPSELSFTISAYSDDIRTPYYNSVTGFRRIWTKHYGIFLILDPQVTGDGKEEKKEISAFSIEKELEYKKFFIEEGTFNFWNPASQTDTVLGRILEIADGWSAGFVSPSLIGRYRTFDDYNEYLLNFIYNEAPEKYKCVFVFDPYQMTINVYDAEEERSPLPIYMDFDTIMQELDVTEQSDELVTAIEPYGSDDLDIRGVNPTGTNWIYDLSWFIQNGDIPTELAAKWTAWQNEMLSVQAQYKGLIGLRASVNAKLISEQTALTDLKAELEGQQSRQSITIQQIATEETDAGKTSQETLLKEISTQTTAKQTKIDEKQEEIDKLKEELEDETTGYNAQIKAINERLSLKRYFTDEEYRILKTYFIEQTLEDETFVASDIDVTDSGKFYRNLETSLSVTGSSISRVDLLAEHEKTMYTIAGGTLELTSEHAFSGDIIRGTMERKEDGEYLLSLYIGETVHTSGGSDTKIQSGLLTISGTVPDSGFETDIAAVHEGDLTTYEGTSLSISDDSAQIYLSTNVTDYQKYSVQMELYEYAVKILKEKATPTYEFEVDSANFLFAQELAPFREKLELGKGIWLRLHDGSVISPALIEFTLDFEKRETIELVFSNRFKRNDNVNTLKDMIESSYSSSHRFETSKYIYGRNAEQGSAVSRFMNSSLDAARNNVLGASNQSVVINGAGIHIGGRSNYKMRIVDNMIAMTEDDWQTVSMALGYFYTTAKDMEGNEIGGYWGVNAGVVGGKLLVGGNLLIESQGENGVTRMFKFDNTGAWMNNATLTVQADNGGRISIDPRYGIVGGTQDVFETEGTEVTYAFLDEDNEIKTDKYGLPSLSDTESDGYYTHTDDVGFFLDIRNGNAYFNGTLYSRKGLIGDWTIDEGKLYSGSGTTRVELNSDPTSQYAIWAGADTAPSAPFWVKRNGDLRAVNGTFSGQFYSTGQGSLVADGATFDPNDETTTAYYLFDGTPDPGDESDEWMAFISYDENGAGEEWEKQNRVIFRANDRKNNGASTGITTGIPIKIESGSDMSLECKNNGSIYCGSPFRMFGPLCLWREAYGAALPASGQYPGQLFFRFGYSYLAQGGVVVNVPAAWFVWHNGDWVNTI